MCIRDRYNPGENEVRALDHINLEINKGEFVAIIGQSGSGKSTFMNMLGCLDVPTSGEYFLNGTDVSTMEDNELSEVRNREIGFIFQGFNLISNLTAIENVELLLVYRGVDRKTRHKLAVVSLTMVGQMCIRDSTNSYGFRPGKSAQQAVLKAAEYMNEGYNWVVDIDLILIKESSNNQGGDTGGTHVWWDRKANK